MTAAATNSSTEVLAKRPHESPAGDSLHSTAGAEVHLRLLSLLEQNPTWTQRQLSDALGVSLGKTNYCLRALKDKGLVKWDNFSQNPNKLQYMHLLTPKGIAQKLQLTAHFLQRKECEFEELGREIARLREELGEDNPCPGTAAALSRSVESPSLNASAPSGPNGMRSLTNGLQRMAGLSDGLFCACGEVVIATEFSIAATPAASRGAGAYARDRALAGSVDLT